MELNRDFAFSLIERLNTEEITSEDLVQACFDRIDSVRRKDSCLYHYIQRGST